MKAILAVLGAAALLLVIAPLVSASVLGVALAGVGPIPPNAALPTPNSGLLTPNPALRASDQFRLLGTPSRVSTAATVAVEYAVAQIGTPYRWGGETPGVGFDCSGLVQAAWDAAGVHLPRVAQDQFDAGPLLPPDSALQPGDLVFFGPEGGGVTHVGMVVEPAGQMVDAPHTGAFVRLEPFPVSVGASWGGDLYLGATRPGGG